MSDRQPFTAFGKWLARPTRFLLYRYVESALARCALDVRDMENLRAVGDGAFILAPNHVQVPNAGVARCGPSPDTFIFEKLVRETTGQAMRTTPLNNMDDNADMRWLRARFLRDAIDQTRKGLVLGLGHLPFQHGDPGSIRAILRFVERDIIPSRRFLLIYPQGRWYPDLAPEQECQDGAAFLSIQFQLAILPAYVRGCDHWNTHTGEPPVIVAFGALLSPAPKNKQTFNRDVAALTAQLKTAMLALRESVVVG